VCPAFAAAGANAAAHPAGGPPTAPRSRQGRRTGAAALPDLTRRLQALQVRAERVVDAPARDRERMTEITGLARSVDEAVNALPIERRGDADVAAVNTMLEEYRVALFAQPMRTSVPVSAKRIRTALNGLRP
jgi:ATP-dependent helicase HrpA